MKFILDAIFKGLALAFDKIPLLNKLKGYRSALGLIIMGLLELVDKILEAKGHPYNLSAMFRPYLIGFTALALNAKENVSITL